MRTLIARVLLLAGGLSLAGCSTPRSLPKYEQPLARAAVMRVRTTAYTHTEDDHVRYTNHNALGGCLKCGPINSAAADWSRWPAGSIFRIRETGEIFEVDDYGWALSGTNTIDLYKPSRAAMNAWGVRRVTIENLRWGDPRQSLAILRQRSRYRHIKRMVDQFEERMAEWLQPTPAPPSIAEAAPPPPTEAPRAIPVAQPVTKVAMAQPAPARTTRPSGNTATREAFLNSAR
jgi:3D (Asp-Asp-Asp) domain-containing protein